MNSMDSSRMFSLIDVSLRIPITHMRTMVLVYLPTKLGVSNGANVGIHIPAPWFAYGLYTLYMGH